MMSQMAANQPSNLACYIHIPFCNSICGYCDFTKLIYKKEWAESYLCSLFSEIDKSGIKKAKTLYIGGGTPSALETPQLKMLLGKVSPLLEENGEFTFEANPESLNEEKIILLSQYGVNRVSLGMQSACPRLLKVMGRNHDFKKVKEAIEMLRKHGINNITTDLIYALPGESDEELNEDIKALLSLNVPHASTYSLILEEGTIFFNKGYKEADSDTQARQFEMIRDALEKEGYRNYEISSFAKPGYESVHNKEYWKDHEYYGFGLGASGYLKGIRYVNTRNLQSYLNGDYRKEEEKVSEEEDFKYYLLTNLRMADGFSLDDFESRFHYRFEEKHQSKIERLKDDGLLAISGGFCHATKRGMMLLDSLLIEFF